MTILAPGSGTIKSTTYEAALIEALQILELAEEATPNPASVNFTDVSHSNTQKAFVFSVALPFETTISTDTGKPTNSAKAYITPVFVAGGGDIKSNYLTGAVLELCEKIQALERSQSINRMNIIYNTDTQVANITGSVPCVRSVNSSGAILTTVTPYLS